MSAERASNVTPMPGPSAVAALEAMIDARVELILKRRRLAEPEMTARELRIRAGLTNRQLEAKSGVNSATISLIENGRIKNSDPATLGKIANALGVPEATYRLAAARGWQGKK